MKLAMDVLLGLDRQALGELLHRSDRGTKAGLHKVMEQTPSPEMESQGTRERTGGQSTR